MKIRATKDYIFMRQPGEPEAYAVTVPALDEEDRLISCGSVTRRQGSPDMWDIAHESPDVHAVNDLPKVIEGTTAEEMQANYRARFKIAMVSNDTDEEVIAAYERMMNGVFSAATATGSDMPLFIASVNAVADYLSLQGSPETDADRVGKIAELMTRRMQQSRERRELRNLFRGAIDKVKESIAEAMEDMENTEEGAGLSPSTPPMQ